MLNWLAMWHWSRWLTPRRLENWNCLLRRGGNPRVDRRTGAEMLAIMSAEHPDAAETLMERIG